MKKPTFFRSIISLALATSLVAQSVFAAMPPWAYDAGPDKNTSIGKELIDLNSAIPSYPELSVAVIGGQKFRPAFGPMPWRMPQQPNSVKILFIGQDGTHIAEAAGRPATAGFGGRAQDLAKYFGVNESTAFINAYAFTIKGQYGGNNSPYLVKMDDKTQAGFKKLTDNNLWLLSQDQDSPLVNWRNRLIDWIIRNNKDSLKLIVVFGGAAQDSIATFIESKGGKVGTTLSEEKIKQVKIPVVKNQPAGGNNEFPVPVSQKDGDVYQELVGKRLDYSLPADQKTAMDAVKANPTAAASKMVFPKGKDGNGLIHAAQLGGYDITNIQINAQKTLSLKGLPLSDGSKVTNDLLVLELPHPTYLSAVEMEPGGRGSASKAVMKNIEVIKPYVKSLGWNIQADEGLTNEFAQDKVYTYGRTGVPTSHYDFGAPAARMVDKSSAKRMGANVVMFGAREGVDFDMNALAQMEKSLPSDMPAKDEMYTTRPRGQQSRYVFDAGPSEKYAKLMKTLDFAKIYKPKRAVTKATDTVDAYIIKTHPEVADFGHYRGTFVNPKVVILADPIGVDDLITARALTGARGQYLHGMMKELGYGDQYLVIKTVPFGMDGASAEDYANVLSLTRDYRKNLIQEVLKDNPGVELILTDGTQAKVEMQSIVGSGNAKAHVINMVRDDKNLSAGIKEAAQAISQAKGMRAIVSGKMSDIPRSHLSYYARLWEGTSGERVLDAKGASKGIAFAEVAPQWATSQRPVVGDFERVATEKLLKKLSDNGLPAPRESMQNFMKRVNLPAAGNQ